MAQGGNDPGRRKPGRVAVLLCMLWPVVPAAADCLDWDEPGVTVVHGTIEAVARIGSVSYRIGSAYSGFNHFQGAVEIRWTEGGTARRQILFHGMHNAPAPALARHAGGLALALRQCARDDGDCRPEVATFTYDPTTRRFARTDRQVRWPADDGCYVNE